MSDRATAIGESAISETIRQVGEASSDVLCIEDTVDPARSLTFRQFNERADQIAVGLLDWLGPGEHRVGVRLQSVQTFAAGILGIDRAGMTSCVMDPAIPRDRMVTLLSDLEPAMVLTNQDADLAPGAFPEFDSVRFVHPDSLQRSPSAGELSVKPAEIARITYTSGSTGVPKGAMLSHYTASDLRQAIDCRRHSQRNTFTLAVPLPNVTMTVLAQGLTLVPFDTRKEGVGSLAAWLREQRIEFLGVMPTLLRAFMSTLEEDDFFPDLKTIHCGGERLIWSDVAKMVPHLPEDAWIVNHLGSTEAGTIAMGLFNHESEAGEGPVPVGRPLDGSMVRIVRPDGSDADIDEAGEIVVEGTSCAIGYWRRPELTMEKFTNLGGGVHRVRTGDGGYFRANGSLEHLGRIDDMVKVAGNRVDLGEVETVLRSLGGVDNAIVVSYIDHIGDTRLWAFVAGTPDSGPVPTNVLRATLARRLPRYMVPDQVEACDHLPRLGNGKVDRQALVKRAGVKQPSSKTTENIVITPSGSMVEVLVQLWSQVLGRSDIGPDDNFFDLGGDSMRAARMFTAIERELGLARPISLLIEFPTPFLLAEALAYEGDRLGDSDWHCLVPVQPEGTRPPLFLIHDGMGEVVYGHKLATELGPDQPVYAIRAAVLSGQAPPQKTVEELAAYYISLMRQVAPSGPYALYGASAGGRIAFSMATQLQGAGEEVSLLAVGDTKWNSPNLGNGWQRVHTLVRERRVKDIALLPIGHVWWQIRARRKAAEEPPNGDPMKWHKELADAGGAPSRFTGSVLLFAATKHRALPADTRPDLGWSGYCTDGPIVHRAHCYHTDLGSEAAVKWIAGPIADALQATDRSPVFAVGAT